jgi:hypothetical protein
MTCQPDNLYERAPAALANFGGTGCRDPQTWYLSSAGQRCQVSSICVADHVLTCIFAAAT